MMDRTSAQSNITDPTRSSGSTGGASKPNAISDQIALLRNDLSGLAETVTGLTKEQLGNTLTDVQHAATDKADEMTAAIRAKPMQSAAIAAGIGFVIGLLMTR